jgi:hypothetical protein
MCSRTVVRARIRLLTSAAFDQVPCGSHRKLFAVMREADLSSATFDVDIAKEKGAKFHDR